AGVLAEAKVSVVYAEENFNPIELRKYVNVLIVPSGGFIYLGNNVSFKLRLEQFVSAGGTVIVMTQQTAADWKLLPGSEQLEAVGYSDEVNWYRGFMYWDQYHPELHASIPVETGYTSRNIDGYFTRVPETAQILGRDQYGRPVWIRYSYGQGEVLAVHDYTDWYGGYSGYSSPFLTDMITWGKKPAALPRVPYTAPQIPGHTFTVENDTSQQSASVEFHLSAPFRNTSNEFNAPAVLAPGESTVITFDAAGNIPGIWHVDYVLRDSEGNEIQPVREALDGRFVIYAPWAGPPVVNLYAHCGLSNADLWTTYVPVDDLPCSLGVSNSWDAARSLRVYAFVNGENDEPVPVATVDLQPGDTQDVGIRIPWQRFLPYVNFGVGYVVFAAYDANLPYDEGRTPIWARIEQPPGRFVAVSKEFMVSVVPPWSILGVEKTGQLSFDPGNVVDFLVRFMHTNMQRAFGGVAHLSLTGANGGLPVWSADVPIAYVGPSTTFQFAVPLPAGLPYGYYVASVLLESDNGYVIHDVAHELLCPANAVDCHYSHSLEIWVPEPVVFADTSWPAVFETGQSHVFVNVLNERRPHEDAALALTLEDPRGTFFQSTEALGFLDSPPCVQGCSKNVQFDFGLPPMQINSTGRAALTFSSQRGVQLLQERPLSSAHSLRLVNVSAFRGGTLHLYAAVERAGNLAYADGTLTCTLQETGETNTLHEIHTHYPARYNTTFAFPRNVTSPIVHVRCEFSVGSGGSIVEAFDVAAESAAIKILSAAATSQYVVPKASATIGYTASLTGDIAGTWPGKMFLSIPTIGIDVVKDSSFFVGATGDSVSFDVPASAAAGRHDYTLRARLVDTGAESTVTGALFVRRPELVASVAGAAVDAGGSIDVEVKNNGGTGTPFEFSLRLESLDGSKTWAETNGTGWVEAGTTTHVGFTVPGDVARGTYALVGTVRSTMTDDGPTVNADVLVENSALSIGSVPGEVVAGTQLDVVVSNSGGRATSVENTLNLKDPGTGQVVASRYSWIWVPAHGDANAGLSVPPNVVPKSYTLEYSFVDNNTGERAEGTRAVLVRNSSLAVGAVSGSVLAGRTLDVPVSNTGPVSTTAICKYFFSSERRQREEEYRGEMMPASGANTARGVCLAS
ncbi:MAG: hypothetical protein HY897_15700, partial [Deltaproteobacteria bacterium]|nr:hypothetical protein [Deltaproteobacteria bacterium]